LHGRNNYGKILLKYGSVAWERHFEPSRVKPYYKANTHPMSGGWMVPLTASAFNVGKTRNLSCRALLISRLKPTSGRRGAQSPLPTN